MNNFKPLLEIFKSFTTDHDQYVQCTISGMLPTDFPEGSVLLNGPGIFQFGDDVFNTLLDGMAVLQQYRFYKGEIHYRNKIIQSDSYRKNSEAKSIVAHELGTLARPDPNKFIIKRYWDYFFGTILQPTDNTVVNVMMIGERLYALTETPCINEINPSDLTIKSKINLRNHVPVHILTAHPLKDKNGTLWNIGTSFSVSTKYCILKTEADGNYEKTRVVGKVNCRWRLSPSYYHSFGMSRNYIVLIEQTVYMPLLSMASATLVQKPLADLMKFNSSEKCIFHIYDKSKEKFLPVTFCANSFVALHHINCYENKNQLIVDLCAHQDVSFTRDFSLENFSGSGEIEISGVEIWRFVLPLNKIQLEKPAISDDWEKTYKFNLPIHIEPQKFLSGDLELPVVNPLFEGEAYRYVYGMQMKTQHMAELVKFDFVTGEVLIWSEEFSSPTTPVFINSTIKSTLEDEGYIVAPVINQKFDGAHFLLILDARTMKESCRIMLPNYIHVPYTFHGSFEKLS